MIRNLCLRLKNGIEVRQTLSNLRQELKDCTQRETFIDWIEDGSIDLTTFLLSDDAKTRKNAALLIGLIAYPAYKDALIKAYKEEQTLFVRPSYLSALKNYDVSEDLPYLKERQKELRSMKMADNEKKHLEEELHNLSDLIADSEQMIAHIFHENEQTTFHCILRTNPLYPEITAQQIESEQTKTSKLGVQVATNTLEKLFSIRTFGELLLQIPGMNASIPDIDTIAKTIVSSALLPILSKNHKGDFPFYFRLGIKNTMSLSERSRFTKKLSSAIEHASKRKLQNSTSHYELEIRLIEGKSGNYHFLVKLYTIPDHRFDYRKEYIPTSIKPVNAALLVQLAKEYMIADAQILDPFCGVGTMLIERQKVIKGNTSYGIDHSDVAIEKAKINTELASQIIHFVNKNCFEFTHEYAFDEIFTEMPYATGQKTEKEIYEIYEQFFPMARRLLLPEGTIIMYTRNREYVRSLCKKQHFMILKEEKITQKPESYLIILR